MLIAFICFAEKQSINEGALQDEGKLEEAAPTQGLGPPSGNAGAAPSCFQAAATLATGAAENHGSTGGGGCGSSGTSGARLQRREETRRRRNDRRASPYGTAAAARSRRTAPTTGETQVNYPGAQAMNAVFVVDAPSAKLLLRSLCRVLLSLLLSSITIWCFNKQVCGTINYPVNSVESNTTVDENAAACIWKQSTAPRDSSVDQGFESVWKPSTNLTQKVLWALCPLAPIWHDSCCIERSRPPAPQNTGDDVPVGLVAAVTSFLCGRETR